MAHDADTHIQFLDGFDRFVKARLGPHDDMATEKDAYSPALDEEMHSMGRFGMLLPAGYGGLGMSMSDEVRAAFMPGWPSPAFGAPAGAQNGIGAQGIVIDGIELESAAVGCCARVGLGKGRLTG